MKQEADDGRLTGSFSLAERAIKKQKLDCGVIGAHYMDVRFLIPTSNFSERIFSTAGHVLNDRRKPISPTNLESQMFLHTNSDLWGSQDVNDLCTLLRVREQFLCKGIDYLKIIYSFL